MKRVARVLLCLCLAAGAGCADKTEVGFDNRAAGLRLAGTLTLPRGSPPYPAIVLIPGAGEVDRDGTLFGHRFYKVLAEALSERGFAVLRSDKRGLGKSGGRFDTATTRDFADDTRAALAYLAGRPDIDARRIGLVGHSEGALVGALAAGAEPSVAFLVMLAGNGIPARDMILAQKRRRLAPAAAEQELAREEAAGPWLRTLLSIDPAYVLRQVRCPVLALVGDRDRVVDARQNIPALSRALAGNPRAEVHRVAGVNHFFQTANSGEFEEVAAIEESMAPRALALIADWAARQLK